MKKLKRAFISYSTDASTKAGQVSKHLAKLGVESFIFEKDLSEDSGGHHARIRSEIEKSDAVILILSVKSKNSSWVSHELGIASGMNKMIIVFRTAHNMKLPDYLDGYQVSILQTIDDLDKRFGLKLKRNS